MPHTIEMVGALEPRSGWKANGCTLARSLGLLSTRSAFLILREAFYGTSRFDDFAERAGLSEPVTAARLRELVDEGLLAREPYREPGKRTRHAYRLTEKGADLLPALVALMQWGDKWLDDAGGPVKFRHRECRADVGVELRCACGHEVGPDDLQLRRNR